jgi:hypothetical protein
MNPETTTRLLALQSLREQAEADARENYEASIRVYDPEGKRQGDRVFPSWETAERKSLVIETRAVLLADPTRKQSQWWMLAEIGRLLGWSYGDQLPFLCRDGLTWMVCIPATGNPGIRCAIVEPGCGHAWRHMQHVEIPGTRGLDYPNAIAAILLHLSGVA